MEKPINNLKYKILAIVLSILLFSYVSFTQNTSEERLFEVPLEVYNLPEQTVLLDEPGTVKVRVQGLKQVVNRIDTRDINAYIDLKNEEVGKHNVDVKVNIPDYVDLISINPSTLTMELVEAKQKQYKVDVVYANDKTGEDFIAMTPTTTPSEIILYGASKNFKKIDKVFVEVDLKNKTNNYQETLPIQIVDKNGVNINSMFKTEPEFVEVLIPIVNNKPSKVLPLQVPIVGKVATGYSITRLVIQPNIMTAFGDYDILDRLSYINTEPLELENAKKDIKMKLALVKPDGVELASNEKVNIVLEISKTEKKTFDNILIQTQNAESNSQYALEKEIASVSVSGAEEVLEKLNTEDIRVFVNVKNLKPGKSAVLELKAKLPNGVKLISIKPETINVKMKN